MLGRHAGCYATDRQSGSRLGAQEGSLRGSDNDARRRRLSVTYPGGVGGRVSLHSGQQGQRPPGELGVCKSWKNASVAGASGGREGLMQGEPRELGRQRQVIVHRFNFKSAKKPFKDFSLSRRGI